MTNTTPSSNFSFIKDGFYTVRTQAGFKQALKHYCEVNCELFDELVQYDFAHPKSYPCLISVAVVYHGYREFEIKSLHFNELKNILEEDKGCSRTLSA